jgi:hypothetical protein
VGERRWHGQPKDSASASSLAGRHITDPSQRSSKQARIVPASIRRRYDASITTRSGIGLDEMTALSVG